MVGLLAQFGFSPAYRRLRDDASGESHKPLGTIRLGVDTLIAIHKRLDGRMKTSRREANRPVPIAQRRLSNKRAIVFISVETVSPDTQNGTSVKKIGAMTERKLSVSSDYDGARARMRRNQVISQKQRSRSIRLKVHNLYVYDDSSPGYSDRGHSLTTVKLASGGFPSRAGIPLHQRL